MIHTWDTYLHFKSSDRRTDVGRKWSGLKGLLPVDPGTLCLATRGTSLPLAQVNGFSVVMYVPRRCLGDPAGSTSGTRSTIDNRIFRRFFSRSFFGRSFGCAVRRCRGFDIVLSKYRKFHCATVFVFLIYSTWTIVFFFTVTMQLRCSSRDSGSYSWERCQSSFHLLIIFASPQRNLRFRKTTFFRNVSLSEYRRRNSISRWRLRRGVYVTGQHSSKRPQFENGLS